MFIRSAATRFAAILVTLAVARPGAASEGTSQTDFEKDIVQNATRAFRGQVIAVSDRSVRIAPNVPNLAYYRVRFRVDHAYRGVSDGQIVSLYIPSADIDSSQFETALPGIATFRVGEKAAIFLNDNNPIDRLVGTASGDLGIRRLVDDREPYVLNANWRAVRYDGSPLAVQCTPDPADPTGCATWTDERIDPSTTESGEPTAMWVDIMITEQLDLIIEDIYDSTPLSAEPVRPVSEGRWRRSFRSFVSSGGVLPAE